MDNHNQASTNYREAFQLFDKRGNGRVDRGALGDLLRACGQNPTLAEIADLERGVGADCKSLIFSTCTLSRLTAMAVDFDTFSKILNRPGGFREPFDIEEYIRGFQVFDKDRSGFVGKGQIKYILTNLGEKMSEEEVDELFKSTIDASNNEVDYRGELFTIAGVDYVGTNKFTQSLSRRLQRTKSLVGRRFYGLPFHSHPPFLHHQRQWHNV